MKKEYLMKKLSAAGILLAATLMLGACGSQAPAENGEPAQQEAGTQEGAEGGEQITDAASETASNDEANAKSDAAETPQDAMVGDWEFAYSMDHSDYDEGESYDYCTMCDDPYAPSANLRIRKEGDQFIADYRYAAYESEYRYYGNELTLKEEAAYDGCDNKDWCMEMSEPFEDVDETIRKITLLDEDTLIETEEYQSKEGDEYFYHSLYVKTFFRKDSEKFKDKEQLRYFNTVEVSTPEELLNAIADNTKVVLNAGTYNLSKVDSSKINNPHITSGLFSHMVDGVSNYCLEGKEGAKVEILIDDAYDAVLSFQNGSNVALHNLTVGHNVEPGYCSGSVVYFENLSGIIVDNCKLYGSGTYGIESYSSSYMDVKDTDIYECTYGLLSLRSTSTVHFDNCTLRDSREYSMLDVDSAYDILFENCEFKNNHATAQESCFVSLSEYDDVTFKKCKFVENEYYVFSNYQVKMEDCEIENNMAVYSDIINSQRIDDASDLLALYEEAEKKQAEADKKLETDETLDQTTLNQMSYESFQIWDGLLNRIWTYLGNTMEEDAFASLTAAQKEWVKNKEAAQKEAGLDFEGGSMQPMVEYATAADWTEKRVKDLINKYLK